MKYELVRRRIQMALTRVVLSNDRPSKLKGTIEELKDIIKLYEDLKSGKIK